MRQNRKSTVFQLQLKTTSLLKVCSLVPLLLSLGVSSLQSILLLLKNSETPEPSLWVRPTWTRWAWVHSADTATKEELSKIQLILIISVEVPQLVVLRVLRPTRLSDPSVPTLEVQWTTQLTAAAFFQWSHLSVEFQDLAKSFTLLPTRRQAPLLTQQLTSTLCLIPSKVTTQMTQIASISVK